jgi:ribosome-associated protein
MIEVGHGVSIREDELRESFLRASGPGGQNVNKLETAVQLRFDARNSPGLPEPVRARLLRMAGHRATRAGEIVITAQRFRTRERNRDDALERLLALIREGRRAAAAQAAGDAADPGFEGAAVGWEGAPGGGQADAREAGGRLTGAAAAPRGRAPGGGARPARGLAGLPGVPDLYGPTAGFPGMKALTRRPARVRAADPRHPEATWPSSATRSTRC